MRNQAVTNRVNASGNVAVFRVPIFAGIHNVFKTSYHGPGLFVRR